MAEETAPKVEPVTLDASPREGQTVTHNGKTFTTIREGLAHILVPANARTELDPKRKQDSDDTVAQNVFYNPIQQFNRDLSVLAIRAFGEDLVALRQARGEARNGRQGAGKRRKGGKEGRGTKRDAEHVEDAEQKHEEGSKRIKTEDVDAVSAPETESTVKTEDVELNEQSSASLPDESGNVHTAQANGTSSKPDTLLHAPKTRFKILDALSATGLRALRYAHEIPFVSQVTANDLSKQATQAIQANVKHNKLEDKITAVTGNAMSHMYSFVGHPAEKDWNKEGRYDVIDLDPYGTAATFLDGAVQAVNNGGMLCVTCTDAGVWASCGYPEKCFSLYGGTPIKGLHSHEGGLRLILHSIATAAARYGLSIEPLLSLSIDYYLRVFVRVYRSPAEVKLLAGKTMLVYSCDAGCGSWKTQFLARNQKQTGKNGQINFKHSLAQGPSASTNCSHCGYKTHMNGPMWGGPLHNPAFIETILNYLPDLDKSTYGTIDRIEGMLSNALEETLIAGDPNAPVADAKDIKGERLIPKLDPAEVDAHPFYFVPSALAKVLHVRAPPEAALKGAFRHAGYKATRSHAKPGVIRTNAPWTFVWEVMREWMRQEDPTKEAAIKEGAPGWGILHNNNGVHATMPLHKLVPKEQDQKLATKTEDKSGGDTKHKPREDGMLSEEIEVVGTDAAASLPPQQQDREDTIADINNHIQATSAATPTSTTMHKIVFDEKLGKQDPLDFGSTGGKGKRLVRYQTNPRANWGPMNRAKGGAASGGKKKE